MKRIILLTVLSLVAMFLNAQKIDQRNVPAVILNAFQLKYANAESPVWRLEKGLYRVDFDLNNKEHDFWMDDKGKSIKLKQELWQSEIPAAVIATIRSKCDFFDLDDAKKYVESGKVTYFINFEIDNKDYDFQIDEKGKLLYYRKELKNSEIPEVILKTINTKYGSFDIDHAIRTEVDGKVNISVEGESVLISLDGEIKDKDHFFLFDGKNKMLEHKQDLRDSEIPVAIMTTISSLYVGYEITDADKIEKNGKITYDLDLRKSKIKIRIIFSPTGEVLETFGV